MKKTLIKIGGFGVGLVNGLLGAGGGMLAVPLLSASGVDEKKSHATSVAVIFALSLLSGAIYLFTGKVTIDAAWPYIPGGIIGAIAGSWLISRIPSGLLRRIFGGFIIYSAIRLFVT